MKENFESQKEQVFTFPDLEVEIGELWRMAQLFDTEDNKNGFVKAFKEKAKESSLVPLTDDLWSTLENTDSSDIAVGDWEAVKHHAEDGHPEHPRDWQAIREKMASGVSLDAPIVLSMKGVNHLVSGNTRLMVARAIGIMPEVLWVEME